MSMLKSINLTISFLLELALIAAVAAWGFGLQTPLPSRVLLGLGLPAVVIALWAVFLARRSAHRVPGLWKPILALILFLGGAALLIGGGHVLLGILFAIVAVLNTVGLYALRGYSSPFDRESDSSTDRRGHRL